MGIVWSHSRINKLLENPAEYYLIYKQGITPISEKGALLLGSAVHYGLEINSADLTDYFKNSGSFKQSDTYSNEQLLAEAMCEAYFAKKEYIFNDLLKDIETGKKLELLSESHELDLKGKVKSKLKADTFYEFRGIIDLLLLTEKGWILCDYKTSSDDVDWEIYKSQLFKYIFLLRENFPEFPLYKICIINLKKSKIRRKKLENDISFRQRLKLEYINPDNPLIDYHIYSNVEFSEQNIQEYIDNLSVMIDSAEILEQNKLYFINYSNISGKYGQSVYANIFYNLPDAQYLYKIKDYIWDDATEDFVTTRYCNAIDMQVLKYNNILNHYKDFEEIINNKEISDPMNYIQNNYIFDEELLNTYLITYSKKYNL